jgi:hypothetical protein
VAALSKQGLYQHIDAFLRQTGISFSDDPFADTAAFTDTLSRYKTAGARAHLSRRILPTIALYEALQQAGQTKVQAKALLERYIFAETEKSAAVLRRLGKLPFFFDLLKPVLKKRMRDSYTDEGWVKRWQPEQAAEISFDMQSCLYLATFTAFGCPELCDMFCRVDEISYGGMSRRVAFLRKKTLANQDDVCDFRFVRQKKGGLL